MNFYLFWQGWGRGILLWPIQLPRVIEWGVGVNNLSPPSPPQAHYYLPAMVLGGARNSFLFASLCFESTWEETWEWRIFYFLTTLREWSTIEGNIWRINGVLDWSLWSWYGPRWYKMVSGGQRWCQVITGGTRWSQVMPGNIRWCQVALVFNIWEHFMKKCLKCAEKSKNAFSL